VAVVALHCKAPVAWSSVAALCHWYLSGTQRQFVH